LALCVDTAVQILEPPVQQAADFFLGIFGQMPGVARVAAVAPQRRRQHQQAVGTQHAAAFGEKSLGRRQRHVLDGFQADHDVESRGRERQRIHLRRGDALRESKPARLTQRLRRDIEAGERTRLAQMQPTPARSAGRIQHVLSGHIPGRKAVAVMHPPLVNGALKTGVFRMSPFSQ